MKNLGKFENEENKYIAYTLTNNSRDENIQSFNDFMINLTEHLS